MSPALTDTHAHAVDLFSAGNTVEAIEQLTGGIRESFELDQLNDLAVMLAGGGQKAAARELLVALLRLDPVHEGARENLAAIDAEAPGSGMPDDVRTLRAQFLQVVAAARETRLIDNLDHFFHPAGHPLPDPEADGERLEQQLSILEGSHRLWAALGDENSRGLLLRYLAYRALGPAHVRLELEPAAYRNALIRLSTEMLRQSNVFGVQGVPQEWHMNGYDLTPAGYPLRIVGQPLPIASTFVFSQYGYRDASAGARPHPGDVAVDVGGCWGETALWLAHEVGPTGQVHTFEPTPSNRDLLTQNVQLNPHHAGRVTTWESPLAARSGETVFIRDTIAAGATVRANRDEQAGETHKLRTDTLDAAVARGSLSRVDFLKLDVEGAELEVLRGAAETIRTFAPRLALAAYHRPEDLITLPAYVESLGPRYRWYLQCSTMTEIDTVLFGVPIP